MRYTHFCVFFLFPIFCLPFIYAASFRFASFLVGLVVSAKPRPQRTTQHNTTHPHNTTTQVMHPGLTWDELNTGIDDALRMGRSGKPSQALQKVI